MFALETRELDQSEYPKWDQLVESSPQGTIFHKSFWLQTCSLVMKRALRIYGCFNEDQLIGGCSLFLNPSRTGLYKTAHSTVGLSPYGGLVLASLEAGAEVRRREEMSSSVIRSLTKEFTDRGLDVVRLANSPEFIDGRPFTLNGWINEFGYTYYFDLADDVEKHVSARVRRLARSTGKRLTARKLAKPDAVIFNQLFSMTFQRQNLKPPVNAEFFERIFEKLASQAAGEMWVAETPDGVIASANVIVWDTKDAHGWAAASHTDFRRTGATTLLLFEILKSLKERNFSEIDLRGASVPRLAEFLVGFNPRLALYFSSRKTTWIGSWLVRANYSALRVKRWIS